MAGLDRSDGGRRQRPSRQGGGAVRRRESTEWGFPRGSKTIDHGPWSELSEGFLGPDYVSKVPDWFVKDYFTYFPTLDQIKTSFQTVDWPAYNKAQKDWQDYYASKIGQ